MIAQGAIAGVALGLLLVVSVGQARGTQPLVEETQWRVSSPRERWAVDLLRELGNEQPTPEMVAMVVSWTIAEDGGDGAFARNNPLNTTICGHNWTGAINSDGACGVGGYATYQDGIEATRDTLLQENFSAIYAALLASDAEGAKRALWASPWASSHYGYGVEWPVYQIEETQASLPCPLDPCWQSGTGYSADHPGVDLGATLGQPVYAVFDGVAETSTTWPCGNGVMVTQGRRQALVCHLERVVVEAGETVRAGQQIGTAGSSGLSTGPHVHFEIRIDGVNVPPL